MSKGCRCSGLYRNKKGWGWKDVTSVGITSKLAEISENDVLDAEASGWKTKSRRTRLVLNDSIHATSVDRACQYSDQ